MTSLHSMAVLVDHDFMVAYGGEARDGSPAAKFSTGDTICFSSTQLSSNSTMKEQDYVHKSFSMFRTYFLKLDGIVAGVCLKCAGRPMIINFYVWKNLQSCYLFILNNNHREAIKNWFGGTKVFIQYDLYKVVYVSADNVSSVQYYPPHKLLENQVSEIFE